MVTHVDFLPPHVLRDITAIYTVGTGIQSWLQVPWTGMSKQVKELDPAGQTAWVWSPELTWSEENWLPQVILSPQWAPHNTKETKNILRI